MKNFLDIILTEIKPKPVRASSAVLINILGTLLMYLVFMIGIKQLLPRIQFVNIENWMYPGIVGYVVTIIAFNLTLQDSFHISIKTGLVDQIHSSPMLTYEIYFLKSLIYLLKSMGHLLLTSLILLIVSGLEVGFANLLLFWIYVSLGLIFINQFGLICGIIATYLKVRSEFTIILVAILFLGCGFLIPSSQYPGIIAEMIHYFPVTILIEGGRDILLYNTISNGHLIYVVSLSLISYLIAFFTFKHWINR